MLGTFATHKCTNLLKVFNCQYRQYFLPVLANYVQHCIFSNILLYLETSSLNALNVPTHNRRYQVQVREHLKQINSYIRDFSEHMSSVFSYLDQRYNIYPALNSSTRIITSVNSKVSVCACVRLCGQSIAPKTWLFCSNSLQEVQVVDSWRHTLHPISSLSNFGCLQCCNGK